MRSTPAQPFEREVKDHWYIYPTPGQTPAEHSRWVLSPHMRTKGEGAKLPAGPTGLFIHVGLVHAPSLFRRKVEGT